MSAFANNAPGPNLVAALTASVMLRYEGEHVRVNGDIDTVAFQSRHVQYKRHFLVVFLGVTHHLLTWTNCSEAGSKGSSSLPSAHSFVMYLFFVLYVF